MDTVLIDKIKKIRPKLLEELFENAYYDDATYKAFESAIENKAATREDSKNSLKELCFELSTVRNRNLISSSQQKKLRNTTVGLFGMSVGSHSALTWMTQSRADNIKIVDFDVLSASNLNRLRFGWGDIGQKKVDVVAKYLQTLNPFAQIITETDVSSDSFVKLFDNVPKIQIVVDAIDGMRGKILLRKLAKERRLPLVSAADVGDNVMLDIERYDKNPQPEFFLGKVPGIEKIDFDSLSTIERKKLVIKLIGFGQLSEEMLDSLLDIGDSLSTWPQLGGTAAMAGGLITNTIKKIVLGEDIRSGRYYLSLDNILVSNFNNTKRKSVRNKKIKELKIELGFSS